MSIQYPIYIIHTLQDNYTNTQHNGLYCLLCYRYMSCRYMYMYKYVVAHTLYMKTYLVGPHKCMYIYLHNVAITCVSFTCNLYPKFHKGSQPVNWVVTVP